MFACDFYNGNAFSVASFIQATGATFPVLLDASPLGGTYGIDYDNYVIVDPDGIVRYTSVHEAFPGLGRWNDAAVRSVVEQWLPTPVQQESWSAMKALYAN